jgi:hypothetical protein
LAVCLGDGRGGVFVSEGLRVLIVQVEVISVLDSFRRRVARYRDLKRGVDEDLVRGVKRRIRLALSLLGSGFFLMFIVSKAQPGGFLGTAGLIIAFALALGGMVLAWLSGMELSFLSRPDPKEPPRLFK